MNNNETNPDREQTFKDVLAHQQEVEQAVETDKLYENDSTAKNLREVTNRPVGISDSERQRIQAVRDLHEQEAEESSQKK